MLAPVLVPQPFWRPFLPLLYPSSINAVSSFVCWILFRLLRPRYRQGGRREFSQQVLYVIDKRLGVFFLRTMILYPFVSHPMRLMVTPHNPALYATLSMLW